MTAGGFLDARLNIFVSFADAAGVHSFRPTFTRPSFFLFLFLFLFLPSADFEQGILLFSFFPVTRVLPSHGFLTVGFFLTPFCLSHF